MTENERRKEARRQKRFEKVGTNEPRCGVCGENDDRCIELHHIAGRKWGDELVVVCRNCHRKVSDEQEDHPRFNPAADPMLDRIGHFLLGLADLLRLIIETLTAFGLALTQRARPTANGELS